MNVNVYVDVLFIINFIINLILLKISSFFMKASVSALRLSISAALGSIYAVCMFFPDISFLYIFPVKLLFSVIMIKIINPRSRFYKTAKFTAVFYMVSFTFAGVLLALSYLGSFSSAGTATVQNGIFYFDVSPLALCMAAIICLLVIRTSTAILKRNKILGIKILKIVLSDRVCEISALSDTGNLLTDPLTGTPVIIAEQKYLEKLFPCGMPDIDNPEQNVKLRLIPYSSLGNKGGMLTGFIPDEVRIDGKKTKSVIIAASPGALSEKDEYNALFNPNILSI